jgi:hypothetical protein
MAAKGPYFRYFGWLALLSSLLSCNKLLSVPASQNASPEKTVYDNDADAESAMRGIYSQMMNNSGSLFNGNISLYCGLSSDELATTNPYLMQDSFYYNHLTASQPQCENLYTTAYYLIYVVNSALQGIGGATGLTDSVTTQLTGEAEFNRALLYFYLVNLYGGVPLVLSSNYTQSAWLARSTVGEVYTQIKADLAAAAVKLPVTYVTTTSAPSDRTRPNRMAAIALQARVWLYQEQWDSAEMAATAVINDGRYQLESNLDQVFLASSREAIWQLQPVDDSSATADAKFFIPAYSFFPPLYVLTPAMLSSYEPGDRRLAHWTASDTVRGQVYVYPYKYKQTVYQAGHPEYEMVLRLAEIYLIRAEAMAEQGNIAGAAADVNVVRNRAGLPNTTASDQASMLAVIQRERRHELATEWGHRWLDLIRTGQAGTVLATKQTGWDPTDALYPLPRQDMLANPNLVQNPGYN